MLAFIAQRELSVLARAFDRESPEEESIGEAGERRALIDAARAVEIGEGHLLVADKRGDLGAIGAGRIVALTFARCDRERQRRDLLPWMLGKMHRVVDTAPASEPRIGIRLSGASRRARSRP
ncbi:MAG TPA: hypothetical protein VFI85_05580 [Methyloceanibacter sp.]|nr:hypothetical protein [Methyloceanibacter sp.]